MKSAAILWILITYNPFNHSEPIICYGPMTQNDCEQFSKRTPHYMKSFCRSFNTKGE